MAYHRQQGVDTHIARIFNTYGPRMRPHDGRAIPTFIRQALADKPLTVFGDGSQTRSFCYVADLVEGFLRLIECPPPRAGQPGQPGRVHDPGAGRACSSRSPAAPRRSSSRPCPMDDPAVRRPDIALARELLGWEPTVELEHGPAPDPRRHGRGGPARRLTPPLRRPSGRGTSASRYGALAAVDGIDLRIEPGECFGFLGPNGAGKTTTMRMLSCLAPRDSGELEVLGIDPEVGPRELKRMLGVVAQDTTLDLELTRPREPAGLRPLLRHPPRRGRAPRRRAAGAHGPRRPRRATRSTASPAACGGASRSPAR